MASRAGPQHLGGRGADGFEGVALDALVPVAAERLRRDTGAHGRLPCPRPRQVTDVYYIVSKRNGVVS